VTIHYADDSVTLYAGDCLDVLRELPDASVDAVVTDPPYGLEFMGKEWDAPWKQGTENLAAAVNKFVAGAPFQAWCELWATECLRVLKPGGHMLAFGGTRTWHRLASAVEDAGFEIRDSIAWLHGQGFPKSMNVNKDARFCQCGKGESEYAVYTGHEGVERRRASDSVRSLWDSGEAVPESSETPTSGVLLVQLPSQGGDGSDASSESDGLDGQDTSGQVRGRQPGVEGRRDLPTQEGQLHRPEVRPLSTRVPANGTQGRLHHGAPASHGPVDGSLSAEDGSGEPHQPRPEGQPTGELGAVSVERGPQASGVWSLCGGCGKSEIPAGLGTALKPAFEPIVVGRKPLAGTVAGNVLAHGTGALNIDACRIEGADAQEGRTRHGGGIVGNGSCYELPDSNGAMPAGRWPANVILDGSQADELDRQSGNVRTAGNYTRATSRDGEKAAIFDIDRSGHDTAMYDDRGGASRFFPTFRYEAKAPATERPREGGVAHPTVKPLDLMQWLVRLVTPPGGTVLEPFAGSGTTAEACVIEGFKCIAIEREPDYLPLIVARLTKPIQVGLDFDTEASA
jgi:DNA modification methylase